MSKIAPPRNRGGAFLDTISLATRVSIILSMNIVQFFSKKCPKSQNSGELNYVCNCSCPNLPHQNVYSQINLFVLSFERFCMDKTSLKDFEFVTIFERCPKLPPS